MPTQIATTDGEYDRDGAADGDIVIVKKSKLGFIFWGGPTPQRAQYSGLVSNLISSGSNVSAGATICDITPVRPTRGRPPVAKRRPPKKKSRTAIVRK